MSVEYALHRGFGKKQICFDLGAAGIEVTLCPPPGKVNGDKAARRPVTHTTGAEVRILDDPYECLEEYLGQNPLQNLAARR
jgi:hypothetical protein